MVFSAEECMSDPKREAVEALQKMREIEMQEKIRLKEIGEK
jgi:hypothetical protein